jgi:hypothetical protein
MSTPIVVLLNLGVICGKHSIFVGQVVSKTQRAECRNILAVVAAERGDTRT